MDFRTIEHLTSKNTLLFKSSVHTCGIYNGSIPNVEKLICYGTNDEERHAEVVAVDKLRNRRYKTLSLLIVNYRTNTGKLNVSMPCINCVWYLLNSIPQLKFIYYTNEGGDIVRSKIRNIIYDDQIYITKNDIEDGKTKCITRLRLITGIDYKVYYCRNGKRIFINSF